MDGKLSVLRKSVRLAAVIALVDSTVEPARRGLRTGNDLPLYRVASVAVVEEGIEALDGASRKCFCRHNS
jgi:hypothetical protein